tara:strand:+ start:83 stop:1288 length:1206 start_codon:yes stop_codon:yes gene_type:complete
MKKIIEKELKYVARNYNTYPLTIYKGKDIFLYDTNGNKYYDFMAGYSAVNQGHCHPRIVNTLTEQAKELTLCSRAFGNDKLAEYSEYMCKLFNYDKILPTNTGVEAGETAIKLARSWAYNVKNIDKYKAKIIFAENNFWGRTITAASSSTDPNAYENFGPFTPGFIQVPYNDIDALTKVFQNNHEISAIMLEPIQGEAGIIIPDQDYLKKVRSLCNKYNVLLICDEVQSGLGRMGSLLASQYFDVKPDVLLLGKALSGGMFPVSAVLADDSVMDCMYPNTHGSTFGGNPLASVVAMESIRTILEEKMIENSNRIGRDFKHELELISSFSDKIKDIRGLGLMNAIEFDDDKNAKRFVQLLIENGILTKTTKENTVRLTPPLTLDYEDSWKSLEQIEKSLKLL